LLWVSKFFSFLNKGPGSGIADHEVKLFLSYLSRKYEDWQVKQAKEAINIFSFYYRQITKRTEISLTQDIQWKAATDEMTRILRLKRRALTTERTYLGWLRSFCRLSAPVSPDQLDSSHVKAFLSHLAVERKVAPATQNQAFNAILFFYKYVLEQDLDIAGAVRAHAKRRLPVVLTVQEIQRLFEHLQGTPC